MLLGRADGENDPVVSTQVGLELHPVEVADSHRAARTLAPKPNPRLRERPVAGAREIILFSRDRENSVGGCTRGVAQGRPRGYGGRGGCGGPKFAASWRGERFRKPLLYPL